jgi:hypothetical protein
MPTPHEIQQREEQIAEMLRTPHTMEELCDKFRMSRSTLQRLVKGMEERHLVKTVPWREGKKKRWVSVVNDDGELDPVVKIITEGGAFPIMNWLIYNEPFDLAPFQEADKNMQIPIRLLSRYSPIRLVANVLGQVWRYSFYNQHPNELSRAQAGSMTPIECKAIVRQALEWTRKQEVVLEQILLAPIWENKLGEPTILERLGNLSADEIAKCVALGQELEKAARR